MMDCRANEGGRELPVREERKHVCKIDLLTIIERMPCLEQ